ncbi:MAG: hypothetical protein KY439_10610 [Actinobacteria bacterium]|nr:hypothetical protein [Actinomycetota bacterium]
MSRDRRPEDWEADLAAARPVEREVATKLAQEPRFKELEDFTDRVDSLDFAFTYRGRSVTLDVKEKRQSYSAGVRELWPQLAEPDMFIVDETVFRRIVWQGGGGFFAIHDVPGRRWCLYGPWELTLGRRVRYGRWGQRNGRPFLKGKLLIDLAAAAAQSAQFETQAVCLVLESAWSWRDRVGPHPVHGARMPELGRSSEAPSRRPAHRED